VSISNQVLLKTKPEWKKPLESHGSKGCSSLALRIA